MSPKQRTLLLDQPEYYPLRVSFLDKVGLLSIEAVDLLRSHDVDFDVDEQQVREILAEEAGLPVPIKKGETVPYEVPGAAIEPASYPTNMPGSWARFFSALSALLAILVFFFGLVGYLISSAIAKIRQFRQPKPRKGLARFFRHRSNKK